MAILLLISIWSWQPYILPYQEGWQLVLCVLLLLFFRQELAHYPTKLRVAMFSDEGQWQWLDSQQVCKVTVRSRFTSKLLWLQLEPVLVKDKQVYWLWVARDSVSDTNYRRLCRMIKRIRR